MLTIPVEEATRILPELAERVSDDGEAEILSLAVLLQYPASLHQRAWQLAKRFNRPTTHDTHYLALAERLECPFWTADAKLYNAIGGRLPWVHLLEEARRAS
jgi:predicted nucleic acid-binding protein